MYYCICSKNVHTMHSSSLPGYPDKFHSFLISPQKHTLCMLEASQRGSYEYTQSVFLWRLRKTINTFS